MNSVGKIFVVLIVILSLMFATMAIMIYATHKNYRQEILRTPAEVRGAEQVGWKYKLQEAYRLQEQLNQQISQLDQQLQAEKIAKIQALAKAEAVIQKLQTEYAAASKELGEKTTALKTSTETLGVAQTNLRNATEEVGRLRTDIAAAHNETDKQIKRATGLTDKLTQAEGQRVQLAERNQQLTMDVGKAKRLLKKFGAKSDDPENANTIQVDGKITEVSRDRVELSIGEHDGVRVGQNLDIYRGDKYVGRVRVVKAEPDSAVGAIETEYLQFPILRGTMSLADFSAEGGRSAVVRKQPPNTYTAMLLAAVVALAIGCLFLFLELQSYSGMSMSTGVSGDARVSSVPQPSAAPAPTAAPDAAAPGTGA